MRYVHVLLLKKCSEKIKSICEVSVYHHMLFKNWALLSNCQHFKQQIHKCFNDFENDFTLE